MTGVVRIMRAKHDSSSWCQSWHASFICIFEVWIHKIWGFLGYMFLSCLQLQQLVLSSSEGPNWSFRCQTVSFIGDPHQNYFKSVVLSPVTSMSPDWTIFTHFPDCQSHIGPGLKISLIKGVASALSWTSFIKTIHCTSRTQVARSFWPGLILQ